MALSNEAKNARTKKRYRSERTFRMLGMGAVAISCLSLFVLLYTIFRTGSTAFYSSQVNLVVPIDGEALGVTQHSSKDELSQAFYTPALKKALYSTLGEELSLSQKREAAALLSSYASDSVRDAVLADPTLIGRSVSVWVRFSSPVDQLLKGNTLRSLPPEKRQVSDEQLKWLEKLETQERVRVGFDWQFLTSGDSREPEQAGLGGAILGSFFTLLVCFGIAFPLGLAAAVYLEEFAPRNRLTEIIEININNLAAVPSIIYGLLGLAVLLNFIGLPRSTPVAGGAVLALMTLPVIIIAARAALRAVPPSIRQGAMAMGASPMQVVLHHVVPLALPGTLTGTIIGLSRALGETAPLIMIGMVAFIVDLPTSPLDSSAALPVQIYLWAESAERGFIEKTSAAIMVILGFLILMNATAVILRSKFEQRW